MKRLLRFIKTNISLATIIVLIISLCIIIFRTGLYKDTDKVFVNDVLSYYGYLPITFIHSDFTAVTIDLKANPKIWTHPTTTGKRALKYSMGMAILYSPFFFVSHFYSHMFGLDTSGFSIPYQFALLISSLIYLSIGLLFLRKLLLIYFDQITVSITLIVIVFGTNLLQYVTYRAPVSHAYSFALYSVFIYFTLMWHRKPNFKRSIILGVLLGVITLIRPSNIVIILFFIFYNIFSVTDAKNKAIFFLKEYKQLLIFLLFSIIIWIPQILYWKSVSGNYLYYSYLDEGFFFSNPQIYRGLFSYRNGWLTYTPVIVFALVGIFMLIKRHQEFFIPILMFTIINAYIILSWWCWWYVGYGNRAFIESYALLSIPLATFLSWVFDKKVLKIIIVPIIAFLVFLNSFMVWQFNNGMGHYDSMTKEAYWKYFLNVNRTDRIWKYIKHPDYGKAKKGIYSTVNKKE
ncbi:MAG: hypothetical protein CL661_00380 [Bacteroidetes bacterium]|nr:hypothetical protein [Bacteroidota bacterium]